MSIDRFSLNDYYIDSIRIHEAPIFCNHCDFAENAYTLTNKWKRPQCEKGDGVYLLKKNEDSKNLIFCKLSCLRQEVSFRRDSVDDSFIKLSNYFVNFARFYNGPRNLSPTLSAFVCKIKRNLENKTTHEIAEYVMNKFINIHNSKVDRYNPYSRVATRNKENTNQLPGVDLFNNNEINNRCPQQQENNSIQSVNNLDVTENNIFDVRDFVIESFGFNQNKVCDHCEVTTAEKRKWKAHADGVYLRNKNDMHSLIFCHFKCYEMNRAFNIMDFDTQFSIITHPRLMTLKKFYFSSGCGCNFVNENFIKLFNSINPRIISQDDADYYLKHRVNKNEKNGHGSHDDIINIVNTRIKFNFINMYNREYPQGDFELIELDSDTDVDDSDECNNLEFFNEVVPDAEELFSIELQNESINNNMK